MRRIVLFAIAAFVLPACVGGEGARPSRIEGPSTAADVNPFDGARLYINPDYVAEVDRAAAAATPAEAARLRRVEAYPTAIWVDSIDRVGSVARHLDAAAAEQSASARPIVIVLVLYDIPNRDCAAASSAGELRVDSGGERRYQTELVDPIAAQFRAHPSIRIVSILEPDSLANLATNIDHPKCAASADAYRRSVAYAIRALSMPNVSLYLDAAHAGWLGWDASRAEIARVFASVFSLAGGEGTVRGFALNVSNYGPLHAVDESASAPGNPCRDELSYVHNLAESVAAAGIHAHRFIVDTSRNGRGGMRTSAGSWCNVRDAGLGERPRASPAPGIDAYYWIKPPGESDGTSDPAAPRYDANCSSPDGTPGAPQAGTLFPAYLDRLIARAVPPL